LEKEKLPKKLLENLYPDEQILYATRKKLSLEKPKWLVVTNRRVIYFDEKILGRYDLQSIPFEKIEKVEFVKGVMSTDFYITLEDGEVVDLSWMRKQQGEETMLAIKRAIEAIAVEPPLFKKEKHLTKETWVLVKPKEAIVRTSAAMARAPIVQEKKEDPYDQLMKLKKLLEEGVITPEEYEEKRRKLLERL
jgi:hypothetical protein